jgi:hypothetical protein
MTGRWQRVSMTRSPGKVFEVNNIFVADENHEAAVDVRQNRKRRRSVFEEDPAPAVPSDLSSPSGHAAESEPSSEVPLDDTSRPSTTTAPLPTMETPSLDAPRDTPRSTAEDTENKLAKTISNGETIMQSGERWDDYLLFGNAEYRQSRPNVQLHRTESAAYQDELYNPANFTAPPTRAPPTNNRFLTTHLTESVPPPSALRSPFMHGSSVLPATPLQDASNMSRPRETSESLDPSSAAYPQRNGTEWSGMGASHRAHQRYPSDQLSHISSAHNSPYMQALDSFDRSSHMLDPSASADPAFSDGLGLGHFSLNDPQSQNFYSPGHSPATSPNDGIREQQEEETAQAEEVQHRSQREPTKSISPKAALVDNTATDRWPFFQVSDDIHDHHLTGPGPFPCNVCNISFQRWA